MTLERLTERIYYLRGQEETDQPYLYYIKGMYYSVVVDAGQSKQHVEEFYHAIAQQGLPYPEYTLITHWHWDHTFGIPYVLGETIGSELTQQKLLEVGQWEWTPEAMKQREISGEDIVFCNNCIRKVYPDLAEIVVETVDVAISEMRELDLGDIHVQLYPMDSIHSRDAMLIYVPEEKTLFVGDADCEDFYEGGIVDKERLKNYISFIEKLDFEHYLIGHDEPETKTGVLEYLKKLPENAS